MRCFPAVHPWRCILQNYQGTNMFKCVLPSFRNAFFAKTTFSKIRDYMHFWKEHIEQPALISADYINPLPITFSSAEHTWSHISSPSWFTSPSTFEKACPNNLIFLVLLIVDIQCSLIATSGILCQT